MAEVEELEVNLLEFLLKSFGFERLVALDGRDIAVFGRTETVSEAKLRPELVRLRVAVPREWVVYDLAADLLRIARDGGLAGPRATGTAGEAAAEKTEFREQGVEWRKVAASKGSFVYVPLELSSALASPAALSALAPA